MSGRALLNVLEADWLDGLDVESRALMAWSLRDPAGFAAHRQEQTRDALVAAGGEIG